MIMVNRKVDLRIYNLTAWNKTASFGKVSDGIRDVIWVGSSADVLPACCLLIV